MNDNGIALANKTDPLFEFGPMNIFPGRLVREDPIDRDLFELALRILIKSTDANITNAVTVQNAFPSRSVRMNSITLGKYGPIITEINLF